MADNGLLVALFFNFFLNGKQNRQNIVQIISIDNQVVITTKK